jgi:hypothetical protein
MEQRITARVLTSVAAIAAAMTVLTAPPVLAGTASPEASGKAPTAPRLLTATAAPTTATQDEPKCVRIRGAAACVGPDTSDRPGITIEDTRADQLHAVVEYHLNGYLGTKYVIHNLAGADSVRGNREISELMTFRAALYRGNRLVRASRWKTVRSDTEYPVKRDTRVTPATARARSEVCTSTKRAAIVCFAERNSFVFACDTRADAHQARAEYFVAGDPTARFEIHQLAGFNTCGKAPHGDTSISKYRASVFNDNRRIATRQYKYN